ncbi:MAG: GNAT family N-acetyltransferase [Rubricoccaceae bacterium]|nr:GNAT family N-acetyltransferase [Rubricoccaceae bacterium]
MSEARIRRATPGDRDAAVALWLALHREHEALDARYRLAPDAALLWGNDVAEWTREDGHLVLLADADGGAVGLLSAHLGHPIPVYAPALFAHVDDLYVRPPWRGRGLGQQMLEEAERWARREGADHLQAGVLALNEGGQAFWSSAGTAPYSVLVTKPLR